MGIKFPHIIMTLRKKRGLSQKAAAADLGISQALLSHYEKGIRECGLSFLMRAADYYGVTTDYLLGRKDSKKTVSDPKRPKSEIFEQIIDSIEIIFKIAEQCNCKELTAGAEAFFSLAVYRFMSLLSVENISSKEEHKLGSNSYNALCCAKMRLIEAERICAASGHTVNGKTDISDYFPDCEVVANFENTYPELTKSIDKLLLYAETHLESF